MCEVFVCHLLITKPELSIISWRLDIRHGLNVSICMWLTQTVNLSDSVFKSQTRHQNGDTHFLTLDEILDETKLLDITLKQKQWLMNEVCSVLFTLQMSFLPNPNFFFCCRDDECWCSYIFEDVWHLTAICTGTYSGL